jgi:SWI/SNF-related matrix-associated actin-dependent regulator of chromatin subfamily B member 1
MGGGGGFNPQMMQQNSQVGGGGTLNPAHLMNGVNHHQQQQQQHQTMNPQQMFQQSHQQPQQQQQQHGMMNGGMGINPASLNSNHVPTNQHPLSGLTREQMQQHFNSMTPLQQQILQAKMAAANAQAAISQSTVGHHHHQQQQQQHHAQQQQQQQFQLHSHSGLQQQQQQQQPQQNPAAQQHALQQILAQQQHQHQQATYFGDRPSSSASSQPQMMPPPVGIPPRPPTAGPGPSSRPGTSHSHGSASQVGLPGGQMQIQRPPSRPTTAGGFDGQQQQQQQQQQQHQYMANGNWNPNQPKPMTPQQAHFGQQMQAASGMQQQQYHQQQQQQQQQQQHHQQHSPPPGSPYRGAKRKVGANGMAMDSPRMGNPAMMGSQMGSGMNMGAGMMGSSMGPPGMGRQISSSSIDQPQVQQQNVQQNYPAMANGFPQQSQSQSQSQQQHQSHSTPSGMRPQSSNGHIPTAPHTPMHGGGGGGGGMSAMLNDPTRMNGMGSIPGGMNMGGLGSNMGLMGMGGGNDVLPRTPQRSTPGGQIPGYPALGSTMPTPQQHRQPSTPAFSPQLPPSLQQSMMQPHGPKPSSLDQAANIGIKMGGLPQLSTGGFTGLDPRPAGLPSRIPSAAPTQPINSSMAAIKQTPPVPGIQPVLGPLPANVQLNQQLTRVTVVPLAGSDKTILPLSPSEIKDIQAWKQADKDYEGIWRKMKERMADELRTATGPSKAAWWEKDAVDLTRRKPREPFDVRYPRQKRDRDGRDRRKTGRREGLKLYV